VRGGVGADDDATLALVRLARAVTARVIDLATKVLDARYRDFSGRPIELIPRTARLRHPYRQRRSTAATVYERTVILATVRVYGYVANR